MRIPTLNALAHCAIMVVLSGQLLAQELPKFRPEQYPFLIEPEVVKPTPEEIRDQCFLKCESEYKQCVINQATLECFSVTTACLITPMTHEQLAKCLSEQAICLSEKEVNTSIPVGDPSDPLDPAVKTKCYIEYAGNNGCLHQCQANYYYPQTRPL